MGQPRDRSTLQIADWPGLVTNSGPTSSGSPPGAAAEQVNLINNVPGEMAARPGYRKVQYDSESA